MPFFRVPFLAVMSEAGIALAVLLVAGVATAQGTRADACASAHAGCVNACDVLEADDAGQAGCAARCAADRAVCEAGKGLDALTEQTDRIQGFLDGLANGADGRAGAVPSGADCDSQQEACSLDCRVRYYGDDGALAGCSSRCMADNAVCQAQAELKSAAPKVKKEVDRWTRFLEGFLDRKGRADDPTGPAPGEEDPLPLTKPAPRPQGERDI
ncbi:MAG: hypothetical protein K9H25_05130 [Rhodospirillum sp.]|nr:hypothetical protein [Rhodospirillum sp.]MCF8490890.1 hypothetical protein [Rhodospirillum sp.]MCF8499932.1 hypothetical protein [Rhodospirillum sp.]